MQTLKSRLATFKADKIKRRLNGQTGLPRDTAFARNWYRRQNNAFGLGAFNWGTDGELFADSVESLGWRDHGPAHTIARLNHTGWFTDDLEYALAVGQVLQLPARNGVAQYVPAVVFTESDGITVYPLDRYDDPKECARAADSYAEQLAEESREFEERERVKIDIEQARESIKTTRRQCLELLREFRQARRLAGEHLPVICGTLAAQVQRYRDDINRERATIERLEALQ